MEDIKLWDVQYLVFQEEIGEQGTPHLQGFVQFHKRKQLSGLKKLNKRISWRPMFKDSTPQANRKYCTKEDTRAGQMFEKGTMVTQGQSTDLKEYTDSILSGMDEMSIIENHLNNYCKYPRVYDRLKKIRDKASTKDWRTLEVIVRYGPAGAGKTRHVVESYDSVYKLTEQNGKIWFDGYEGEDVLLIDDFYGWIPYNVLLSILDGYQLRLEFKGGYTYARWTKVFITSNNHPSTWYDRDTQALDRRIKQIQFIEKNSGVNKNAIQKTDILETS
jgi:hypothetical protein